jgi:carboxymethylenebutenolidase
MTKQGKKADFSIYSDAGHAFENPNNKDGYRPKDAQSAWKRIVVFFSDTLKK